ncbi:hypothetical protein [uncultured Microbacterium sp.]|uniref:hypothetical protein n=1 Tax=uncultured Microbacterium sp. TaxID=191216 RepID=UPI0025FECA24|nr:hypothetical protein [uncultured Microbacterium sp.]
MTEIPWLIPTAIALGVIAVLVLATVVTVRVLRRSPRARAAASAALGEATAALGELDDAVDDLDVAFEALDAVEAGDLPADLRRARATARRARDRGFADVLDLSGDTSVAASRRDRARQLTQTFRTQTHRAREARSTVSTWARTHREAEGLRAAAWRRRDAVVAAAGDPAPLLAVLRERFDPADRSEAERAAQAASLALSAVDAALARNDEEHLLVATRALRRAARCLRAVEDEHRIAVQAAENAAAEIAAARAEMTDADAAAAARPEACAPDATARLRSARDELDAASTRSARRPREAIAVVARVRAERDRTVGEALTPRRRLEAARAALPGTLACARAALATAEANDAADDIRPPIARRLRLEDARRRLAVARAETDAAPALEAARAAWRALADD